MKGFIEVTNKKTDDKLLVNINLLRGITARSFIFFSNDSHYIVKESYDEIKELIKNAQ